MSLATRCTSCGTAFRVVQDQLKVSEGWVRCGRCNEVFSALEGLFDLGREAPELAESSERAAPAARAAASSAAGTAEAGARPPGSGEPTRPAEGAARRGTADEDEVDIPIGDDEAVTADLGNLLADPIDAHLFGPRKRTEAPPKPAADLDRRDRVEFSDARFDSDLFPENPSIPDTELVALPASDADTLALDSASGPEFVRRADRHARWQSRPARVALSAAALLATVVFALQLVHHYRDTIAARWPALRAPVTAWCQLARCRIEAPRRIDEVLVESTALTKAAAQDAFLLSVTLRNRSAMAVTMPSIDLALTDATGRLVARRALAPRDFDAADVLPAQAEAPLQVLLTAGAAQVVGYTVEIFYP